MKKLILLSLLVLFGCSKEQEPDVPEIIRYTLTVTANPTEGGLVNPQTGTYNAGQTVNIVASANDFFAFSNWTGNWNGSENSFTITMDSNKTITGNFDKIDLDEDGILNDRDNCPNTSVGSDVDNYGCSLGQKDSDNDGYTDDIDLCPGQGGDVDSNGCPDDDDDGIPNNLDQCPYEYGYYDGQDSNYVTVDSNGCKINYVTITPDEFDYTVRALDNSEIGQFDVIWLPGNDSNSLEGSWTSNNRPFIEKKFKIVGKDEFRSIIINGVDPGFIPVTSKITDMESMFSYVEITPYLKEVIKYMDVSNVTNMFRMYRFSYVENIESYGNYLEYSFRFWDTENVVNMGVMFSGSRLGRLDLNSWNTSSVKNMRGMFNSYHYWKKTSYPFSVSDPNSNNYIGVELRDCPYQILEPNMTNGIGYTLGKCEGYNMGGYWTIRINEWDVSSVESFAQMFLNYRYLLTNLEDWDTSSATEMFSMFERSRVVGNLERWDVSNVTDCSNFANLAELDTGIVIYNNLRYKIYADMEVIEIPEGYRLNGLATVQIKDLIETRLPNFTNCSPN
tara:strand:+ start:325 stop:2004 length:1680 start_codon:yes stop_codon:yes gene_type:complete